MRTETVLFTSLKGGCGKSTVCINAANALCEAGKRVLVVSLDALSGSIDLMMDRGDSAMYDILDFPERPIENIAVDSEKTSGLSLAVCMPFSSIEGNDVGKRSLNFVKKAKESGRYDLILIDRSADIGRDCKEIALFADRICIVSTQMDASLRCAQLLGEILLDAGVDADKMSLVLDQFYIDPATVGAFMGINDIIDETKLPLIGIIPFSDELHLKQTLARDTGDKLVKKAFSNLALRMLGEDVKMLDFLPIKNRRMILNN